MPLGDTALLSLCPLGTLLCCPCVPMPSSVGCAGFGVSRDNEGVPGASPTPAGTRGSHSLQESQNIPAGNPSEPKTQICVLVPAPSLCHFQEFPGVTAEPAVSPQRHTEGTAPCPHPHLAGLWQPGPREALGARQGGVGVSELRGFQAVEPLLVVLVAGTGHSDGVYQPAWKTKTTEHPKFPSRAGRGCPPGRCQHKPEPPVAVPAAPTFDQK